MNALDKVSKYFFKPDAGLFIVRAATAYVFIEHGIAKVTNIAMPVAMMAHFGFPGWVGMFIAWLEVIGGIALVLGIFTRVFAVAFLIEMIFAVFLTGFARGLGVHDLEILLALNAGAIALAGSGKWRITHLFEHA